MQGLVLTCPSSPITLAVPPPAGRLAGLTCFMAGSSQDVVLSATPQRNVQDLVVVPQQMSAGSVFAIIVAVLAGLAALGGVAFLLYKRKVGHVARLVQRACGRGLRLWVNMRCPSRVPLGEGAAVAAQLFDAARMAAVWAEGMCAGLAHKAYVMQLSARALSTMLGGATSSLGKQVQTVQTKQSAPGV